MLPNELPNENEPAQEPVSPTETTPAAAPPSIPQPQQNFATRDDLMAIAESVKAIAAAVQQGAATRTVAPPIPEVSDDEVMASINEGKPTVALKRMANQLVESIVQQHIAPLRAHSSAAMATLVRDAAKVSPDMPYFNQLEKQIDALVASVTPEQRADPNTYRTAYAIAAGQNMPIIIKAEVEKAMRAANTGDGGTVPGGTPRPTGYAAGVPTVGELFGEEAEKSLKAQGWTPDQYAQKILHHKTWADAAVAHQKFNEEHPSNA